MGEAFNLTERETVERETVLPAGPDEVWEALTDDDRLEEWLAEEVELDLVEGGELSTAGRRGRALRRRRNGGRGRAALVHLGPPGGEDASRVSFEIEPVPGGTRLVVTETRIAGPTGSAGIASGFSSWAPRLHRLGRAIELAPVA